MGKFECFLKAAFGDARCHEYSYKDGSTEGEQPASGSLNDLNTLIH